MNWFTRPRCEATTDDWFACGRRTCRTDLTGKPTCRVHGGTTNQPTKETR
jgi:hypothetical protein